MPDELFKSVVNQPQDPQTEPELDEQENRELESQAGGSCATSLRPAPGPIAQSFSKRSTWRSIWDSPVTRIVAFLSLTLAIMTWFQMAMFLLRPWLHRLDSAAEVLSFGSEALAAVLSFWIMVRFAERRRMSAVGFQVRGIVTDMVAGCMIGMATFSVTIGILATLGVYRALGVQHGFSPWQPLLVLLLVGIAEETIFRGFVFRVLEYRWGTTIALIASGLFFGLIHGVNGHGMIGPLFISFEFAILATTAYVATRRLWLGIGIHWAWNYFEGPIYGTEVSGSGTGTSSTLIHSTMNGPAILTGGTFGPEASLVCLIVGTLAGLLMLCVAIRSGNWKLLGQWQPQSLPASMVVSSAVIS